MGGLNKCFTNINWDSNSGTKIIFHMCDAPPHGKRYYPGHDYLDYYPSGDPSGIEIEDIATKMQEGNIQYYFGKINNTTDGMFQEFKRVIGEEHCARDSFVVGDDADKVRFLEESVTFSISSSNFVTEEIGIVLTF